MKRIYPYILAFFTGYCIMALELLGFRIFSPYFGNTIYVWGSLIGVIMLALSAGYFLGGFVADRKPDIKIVHLFLALSLLYLVPVNIFYPELLNLFSGMGERAGSLLATLALFGVPMLLLSSLSPFLIKITARDEKVGMSAGKIYSISTAGSLFGVFLTSFTMIPKLGSFRTFVICNVIIFALLLLGLSLKKLAYPALILLILPLFFFDSASYLHKSFRNMAKWYDDVKLIYIKESPYNLVFITRYMGRYTLHLNKNSRHSYFDTAGVDYSPGAVSYREMFRVIAGLFDNPQNILVLGLGGGTSLREYLKVNPEARIDGVEIDPDVIEASRIFFGLREDENIRIHLDDARPFIYKNERSYDFIEIDTFSGNLYIPFYLATSEFFKLINERLSDEGIFVMNVASQYAEGPKDYVADAVANTMKCVFPSVFSLKLRANRILFGMKSEVSKEDIMKSFQNVTEKNRDTALLSKYALDNTIEVKFDPKVITLTDDHAPIEELTRKLIYERELYKARLKSP